MDKEAMLSVLGEAAEICDGVKEPYRAAAFQVVVQWLLARSDVTRVAVSPEASSNDLLVENVPATVNELLARLHSRSHPDRVEAIAFHALKRLGIDGVASDDILAAYSSSRLPRPVNLADTIAKSVRRGHLMDGQKRDGQKTWRLTVTGERYIDELLKEIADR